MEGGRHGEYFLEEDAHIRDPGVYVFDTAYCLASSHHLLKCNRANSCAAFSFFLSLASQHNHPPLHPMHLPTPPCSLLSFSYSLTQFHFVSGTFCRTVSLIFTFSQCILFSFIHSHIAAHPPSAFSLSVLTPWGKWSYVNCFLLDVHSA